MWLGSSLWQYKHTSAEYHSFCEHIASVGHKYNFKANSPTICIVPSWNKWWWYLVGFVLWENYIFRCPINRAFWILSEKKNSNLNLKFTNQFRFNPIKHSQSDYKSLWFLHREKCLIYMYIIKKYLLQICNQCTHIWNIYFGTRNTMNHHYGIPYT